LKINLIISAMKKMILTAVLVLVIGTVSLGKKIVAEGKTFSALGDYRIESTDNPFNLKGEDCKAYKISYQNTPLEVTLVVCKERDCKKFVVLSEKLSVQYICNSTYFGVERLDKSLEKEGYKTSDENLNRFEYFHQKVLGPGQIPELDATKTIAAYFPFLLKSDDNSVGQM
jgi:hypothetical protein